MISPSKKGKRSHLPQTIKNFIGKEKGKDENMIGPLSFKGKADQNN